MPGVLIDTDIAIDYLRGEQAVRPLVDRLWQQGVAYLSVLSVFELTAGMRELEQVATMNFVAACVVIEVTSDVAAKGGGLYRHYRSKGITLTPLDCLIAATAMARGLQVATRNVRHCPEQGLVLDMEKFLTGRTGEVGA